MACLGRYDPSQAVMSPRGICDRSRPLHACVTPAGGHRGQAAGSQQTRSPQGILSRSVVAPDGHDSLSARSSNSAYLESSLGVHDDSSVGLGADRASVCVDGCGSVAAWSSEPAKRRSLLPAGRRRRSRRRTTARCAQRCSPTPVVIADEWANPRTSGSRPSEPRSVAGASAGRPLVS